MGFSRSQRDNIFTIQYVLWRFRKVYYTSGLFVLGCFFVFAPKYRRKIIYGQLKRDIANILSMLCKRKGVKIVEAEVCPDHIHMLVEIPPSISVSSFVGYLKGKSTLMIFERHANLKYKYGNRHFWCRGYYVDTVGKNAKKIQEYIQNQLKEDLEYDQMTLKEYIDPFTGEPVKTNR